MPAIDVFRSYGSDSQGPATHAADVAPSDGSDISHVTRAIYVGGAGDLRVTLKGGGDVTFRNLGSGVLLPVRATRVWQSGTTAGDLVALW